MYINNPLPQALLAQFVVGLRNATAARADERVRLTGEVISGALAMKMLGWEDPFTDAICDIRKKVGSEPFVCTNPCSHASSSLLQLPHRY